MTIYAGTFIEYEKLAASKLNAMVSAINTHTHDDRYYTKTESDDMADKVKASSSDATSDYLDGKVDSATLKIASEQITVGVPLGDWVALGATTSGTAATDGFILGMSNSVIYGYTPTGTLRVQNEGPVCGLCMPVRKGDTWTLSGSNSRYWIPVGS